MSKVVKDKFKHFIIYLISFGINYLMFILLMLFVSDENAIGINIVNLIAWILSMIFIFYIDKKYVPDLVDENNSSELFKFILIRIFSLIVETLIIYIFIIILNNDYYLVKLISLLLLFIFNEFYVKNFKYK
ncbi:MAG: GtrA family protein [Bacilli bacterium]|nr:GtrA family protein [Bacilli bacterium]